MSDDFAGTDGRLNSPAANLAEVTPNDSADLAKATRAINVAASGTVKVTTVRDQEVTIYVAAGVAFPVRAKRIWATGTTATDIVAMW